MLTPTIDLPPEKECRITLGNASWNVSVGQNIMSSLPHSPLTGGASPPTVAGRSTIKFGQAVITFTQPALDYPFFKKPASTPISMPQKGWGTPDCTQLSFVKGIPMHHRRTLQISLNPQLNHRWSSKMWLVMMMMRRMSAPAPDRSGSSKHDGHLQDFQTARVNPSPRKRGLKIWRPVNQGHAKCPMHCRMNGVSVDGSKKGARLQTNVLPHIRSSFGIGTGHIRKSVPLINLHSHIHPLCELWTNRLQAPRAPTAKPPTGSNRATRISTTFGKRTRPW